jgi:hypothetical protein
MGVVKAWVAAVVAAVMMGAGPGGPGGAGWLVAPAPGPLLIEAHVPWAADVASCSAFAVRAGDRTVVVTARHALEVADDAWVNLGAAGAARIKAVVVDRPDIDLIVVETDPAPPGAPMVLSARGYLRAEEPVAVVRAAPDGSAARSEGTLRDEEDRVEAHRRSLACATAAGWSGSPALDASGEVVGMVVGVSATRTDCVGAPAIAAALAAAGEPEPLPAWLARARPPGRRAALDNADKSLGLLQRNQDALALAAARSALETCPASHTAARVAMIVLDGTGLGDEVPDIHERAAKAEPKERSWPMLRAESLYSLGRHRQAAEEFERALAMGRTPAALARLAECRAMLGSTREGLEIATAAAREFPNHRGLRRI